MKKGQTDIAFSKIDFEKLFKDHFVHLCNFARGYLNDTEDAKEIVQEVFFKLWQNRDSINLDKSVKSYLFTSVRNRSLNFIRDHKKFKSQVLDVDIADYDLAFEQDVFSKYDLENRINVALNKLPEKCREVFVMSRQEELKYKEIAEKLNISVKTVEAQMSKALRILREELKDYILLILLFLLK